MAHATNQKIALGLPKLPINVKKTSRRFANGGAIDEHGNDLTRSNQMGAAADKMEAQRIARNMGTDAPAQQIAAPSSAQGVNADMINLGKIDPTPGEGGGAAHNWLVKSATDISNAQGLNPNSAYKAAGIGRPREFPPSPVSPGQASQPIVAQDYMQQVDALFPSRRGLSGFADGGVVKETPEQLMARMQATYGTPAKSAPVQAIAQLPPAPAPQPQAPAPRSAGIGGLIGLIKGRQAQIDKATNYANGGKIRGPGTQTSDSIPAQVKQTGEPIAVSTGERIVSAAQDALLQKIARGMGFDSLDALLEQGTGKPVGPTMNGGMAHAAFGLSPAGQELQGRSLAAQSLVSAAQKQMGQAPDNATAQNGGGMASVATRGNQGLQAIAQNVGVRDTLNAAHEVQGDGIRYDTTNGVNGKSQVMISGASPTKEQYLAADGTPTNEWNKTSDYQQAIAANVRLGSLAERMERYRLKRDAFDPSITSDRVRGDARMQIAEGDRVAMHQGEVQNRVLEGLLKQTKLDSESRLNSLQAAYANEADQGKKELLGQQIRGVMGRNQDNPDRITLPQASSNLEIDAARKTVAGLSPEEIRRRTSKQTNTGRENPNFDMTLEHALALSGRRKIGTDDYFDAKQQAPQGNDGDKVTRFRADPAMTGHTMGKQTESGVEVLDASGKIIGHYR